ncbi:MAG: putative sulfate exporter family transporter, partial [Bradyrhizobium sp.]|nr:putative sulfate exporter family transporter [Bradyrhizobium sp.]
MQFPPIAPIGKYITFRTPFSASNVLKRGFVAGDNYQWVQRAPSSAFRWLGAAIPGIGLCLLLTLISFAVLHLEERVFAHPYVEALVIAILLGMVVRSFWRPSERWQLGIAISAKQLLEIAVTLLGASISFATIASSGSLLLAAIVGTVLVTLAVSFAVSRALGLPTKLSILIACGNSICGNSAIAAVAPVIGAEGEDIASSISFTAVLGVLMVLGLPLLIPLLRLSATQYGILAGLTVYAVPQVLAATIPAGVVSTQIGTLVKLVRVLMLGPVVLGLSLIASRRGSDASPKAGVKPVRPFRAVPWFIIGFLVLAALRSLQVV